MAEQIVPLSASFLILVAAWQDFTSWKIRNWTVLALLGVYACLALSRWLSPGELNTGILDELQARSPIHGDIAAGLLLFTIGFVLWALKMFGAGDAKLFLPVGLFVGWGFLVPFGMALAVGAVFAAIALKFPMPLHYQAYPIGFRIEEIRRTGKVPYGVVIAAAALFAMYLRYWPG